MSENAGYRAFTAGEALFAFRLVKIKSGTTTTPPEVVYADSDEAAVGVVQFSAASGAPVSVRLVNVSGTCELVAGEAFAVGASLYAAADGKVVDTDPGSGTVRYQAFAAATADGDVVECLIL
jgi:hypothetical protein